VVYFVQLTVLYYLPKVIVTCFYGCFVGCPGWHWWCTSNRNPRVSGADRKVPNWRWKPHLTRSCCGVSSFSWCRWYSPEGMCPVRRELI